MAEEIDHIAELQKRLYARDPESLPKRRFGILRPLKENVSSAWGQTKVERERIPRRTSIAGYKRFFVVSLFFFLIALGAALFSIYRGAVTISSKNVDLTILGNSFIAGGETLPIQVEIANKNSSDLINATLSVDYPKGATDQSGSSITHLKQDLGTVASGKTKSVSFSLVLYGEQGSTRDIKATLDYNLVGSTATFEKQQTFSVMISSSPVSLVVDGPAAIGSGQPLTFTIRNAFSGDQVLSNVITRVEYPNGFVFDSATPAPTSGTNIWSLGDMEKGTERVIVVHGKLVGENSDQKSFRIYTGTPVGPNDNHVGVAYNSALKTIAIQQPFISGKIAIGNQDSDVVALPVGSAVAGTINWVNNATITVTRPIFTLLLEGDNINPDSIAPERGYYNELDHTMTWTADSDSDLASIAPGQSGQLKFAFNQKDASGGSDIRLALSVDGTFPDRDNQIQSIKNIDEKTIRFASRLQFASFALYSTGPIKNSGPFPPRANQETSYTVTWTARPAENPLAAMKAAATLPPGVTWIGTAVPASENISYSPETRAIIWNIGALAKATKTPVSKTVTFQIKVRPTKSQVGSELSLLSETILTATDTVANTTLSITKPALSTRLDADPSYTPGAEKVLP